MKLPNVIISYIISFLDVRSRYRLSRCSRVFRRLTADVLANFKKNINKQQKLIKLYYSHSLYGDARALIFTIPRADMIRKFICRYRDDIAYDYYGPISTYRDTTMILKGAFSSNNREYIESTIVNIKQYYLANNFYQPHYRSMAHIMTVSCKQLIKYCSIDIIKLYINSYIIDVCSDTLLSAACSSGCIEIVDYVWSVVNQTNICWSTVLISAIKTNKKNIYNFIISHNSYIIFNETINVAIEYASYDIFIDLFTRALLPGSKSPICLQNILYTTCKYNKPQMIIAVVNYMKSTNKKINLTHISHAVTAHDEQSRSAIMYLLK